MTVFINESQVDQTPKGVCLSVGCFDGIHLGHQQIIKKIKEEAGKTNSKTCLCIFRPHPIKVLKPDQEFKNLFTLEETEKILKNYDIDYLCVIPFSLEFSKMSSHDFIHSFLYPHFKPSAMVVGYDFSFGFQQKGDFDYLKTQAETLNFEVYQVPALSHDDQVVSSSTIKKELSSGNIKKANEFLSRPFFVEGMVIKGDGRGSEIGFPTANIEISEDKYLPQSGVYACWVHTSGGKYKACLNLGFRPTFKKEGALSFEVHLLEAVEDLYSQNLVIEIMTYIRPEMRFSAVSELQDQIKKDISEASEYLNSL